MALGAIVALGSTSDPLPNLSANREDITVSGNSAGGKFSCHLMWTASDTWKGAGCNKSGIFDVGVREGREHTEEMVVESIDKLLDLDDDELIDPLENLSSGKRAVIIISSSNDRTVPPTSQLSQFRTFVELGMNGDEGDPNQRLKLYSDDEGHNFRYEYSKEILDFLWDKLDYGVL